MIWLKKIFHPVTVAAVFLGTHVDAIASLLPPKLATGLTAVVAVVTAIVHTISGPPPGSAPTTQTKGGL